MNPFWIFLALFVGVPLFELYLLIEVGASIGALPTIALSILTAILGGFLMRQQGLQTALRAQASLARGEAPALEMLEGVVIFLAGFVLLFPGFFTDLLGFLLLIPPLRRRALLLILDRVVVAGTAPDPWRSRAGYIEGNWRREDDGPGR